MKVTALVEQPDGVFQFTADLTPEQHQFLIEFAIRALMAKGLIPFSTVGSPSIQEASETKQ